MDSSRFRTRARELRAFAERLAPLAKRPDRVTAADVQQAADLATKAADSLDELLAATPPGCECRQIETDNYSYLDYAESCRHHRQYYILGKKLGADYDALKKTLKDETRLKLIAAALSGTPTPMDVEPVVARAIKIADEAIRQLTESA